MSADLVPAPEPMPDALPDPGGSGLHELDPRLLSMLVCPLTRGPLRYDRAAQELVSPKAGLAYRIMDGIPIMLPDEARLLDP